MSLGFSHSDTPIQEEQTGLYEPWQQSARRATASRRAPTITDGIKALRRTGYIRRNAAMATVQFRRSTEWTSTLDIFHS